MYDYYEAVENDLRDWLDTQDEDWIANHSYDDIRDIIFDSCVTGNDGDPYDTNEQCEEYLKDNLELVFDAMYDFDVSVRDVHRRPAGTLAPYLDTLVRCYVLDECIDTVLPEYKEEDE